MIKSASQTTSRRKLIKANIKLNLSLEDDDVDEDEQRRIESAAKGRSARPMSAYFSSTSAKTTDANGELPRGATKSEEQATNEANKKNQSEESGAHLRRLKRCKNECSMRLTFTLSRHPS